MVGLALPRTAVWGGICFVFSDMGFVLGFSDVFYFCVILIDFLYKKLFLTVQWL
jgi:cytochrome c biogenesis protein CcdA